MRKVLIASILFIATPAFAIKCEFDEYVNDTVCTTVDIGHYWVGCRGELPNEYTELEYLESDKQQYIDTGVIVDTLGIHARIDFQFTKIANENWFIGAFLPGGLGSECGWTSTWVTGYGCSYSSVSHSLALERQIATLTFTGIPNVNLYIFARKYKDGPEYSDFDQRNNRAYVRIFSTQIYNGDTMIRDFVPARRDADGMLGMYDLVENKFYTNDGDGEFITGRACPYQNQCEIGYYCIDAVRYDCTNRPDNSAYTTTGWTTPECPWTCDTNYVQTAINTCAKLCAAGATKLRTSTGVNVPLFAARNTIPAINIDMNENVCYADLVPGQSTGAINIQYDGKTYHTVK